MEVTKSLTLLLSLNEADVLNGDIYGLIAPYATANLSVPSFPDRHVLTSLD